ncbi:MAG: glutaminyl-peptide cyclotransferase [Geminicoccaceae bacterium]
MSAAWSVGRIVAASFALLSCTTPPPPAAPAIDQAYYTQVTPERVRGQTAIPVYGYRVVRTYPHDASSYTEGLVMSDGLLYEGTGLYGRSKLRKLELQSGRVIEELDLAPKYFGEGVTVLGDKVFQLTYLSNDGFVYDKATFAKRRDFHYADQGWGLTTDGHDLIRSNGSAAIQFVDPATLEPKRYVIVSDNTGPVGFLNELEYVDGSIYANVWQTHFIVRIDPSDGKITGWIDLTGINPDPAVLKYPDVLNGIAYKSDTDHLLVTGKRWPSIFEIEMVPSPES